MDLSGAVLLMKISFMEGAEEMDPGVLAVIEGGFLLIGDLSERESTMSGHLRMWYIMRHWRTECAGLKTQGTFGEAFFIRDSLNI